jgi:hypothetical protein
MSFDVRCYRNIYRGIKPLPALSLKKGEEKHVSFFTGLNHGVNVIGGRTKFQITNKHQITPVPNSKHQITNKFQATNIKQIQNPAAEQKTHSKQFYLNKNILNINV